MRRLQAFAKMEIYKIMEDKIISYGGQAVIEGVMMRGQNAFAIAMRAPDGKIVTHKEDLAKVYRSWITKIPFVRGTILLWDALGLGMKALTVSANTQTGEEEKLEGPALYITLVTSILIGVGLFVLLPAGVGGLAELAALLPVPVVAVPALSRKVGLVADRFYGHPSRGLFMIGITGTDGKTSCSHYIAQALDSADRRCGVIGTLGYGLYGELNPGTHTTPDGLALQRALYTLQQQGARCVVSEVSSHAMDQGRINGVHFDVAVLTNLSRDHLDYHGDIESYAHAKRQLFHNAGLRYAVINADDPFGRSLLDDIPPGVAPVAYTLAGEPYRTRFPTQWVVGRNLGLDLDGMQFEVVTPWGGGVLKSQLLGRFNASNLLASLAGLCVSGLPFDEALRRLARTRTVAGRMERFELGAGRPLAGGITPPRARFPSSRRG